MIENIRIRKYRQEDRSAIREISIESSIIGEYQDRFFDKDFLADIFTVYFTDCEPSSCFVAVEGNNVVGYLLGARNVKKMRFVMKWKILPGIMKKNIVSGKWLKKNNLKLLFQIMISFLKGEFRKPDFTTEYPATLHINIATPFRGKRIGTQLMEHFLAFLKEKNVKGVHFGVLSEDAREFFLKQDFKILFHGKYTFLKYLTGSDFPHYIMGKNL